MMDSDGSGADFCRFCRSEASSDRPLFHPCICTGSIKWIHQECLVQWMRYSRKEICELCGHRFSFMPIYSPDMPRRLPITDVVGGLVTSVASAVKDWLHYTLVALAWLGIVPLTACRTYRCLFSASLDPVISLPFDIVSAENLAKDVFSGCFVVTCTLFSFIGLVWLREQIMHGGGPDWMERENLPAPPAEDLPLQDNNNDHVNEGAGDDGGAREEPNAEGGDDALVGDEANWNPMEWDRAAAEELTWARLLGLDGSMVFLEHVFWVVSLNTLFIVVFAFCPYHIGKIGASIAGLAAEGPFAGLLTALAGYVIVGAILAVLHGMASLLRLRSAKKALGFCYVVVKVALLSVVEIGVIPLVCGWWLDLCSLSMFDATLKDRESSLQAAPWTLMFIHWLVGMVYVYYFASFILLLREVLRPGVLWFLKNLNDPDFSPVQEMIHLPVWSHIRRLVVSAMVFGTAVLFMLWLPIRVIKYVLPGFLPYAVAVHTEAPVNELSLELLLLQALMWRDGPAGIEPYVRVSWFPLRLGALLALVSVSLVMASALTLVLVIPLRVPLEQSPVLFVWQDWALGVLYTKIVCALTMMGPDWSMRRAIEKAYRDGIREMDLKFILREVAAPLVRWLGLALAVPYALAHSVAPLVVTAPAQRNLLARRVYPALLLLTMLAGLALFQIRQFRKLYEHIKNDKYLVGQRLVNYDHRRHKQHQTTVIVNN
ncbi:jg11908 [Pararge aegeria aegeria]|uniref:RING-type E3 ubiquitin transferase n=1 Tax=Pararge aegeria aegeria TaxID=348720 RepID=A0A8S4RY73_9NEOP|nr:jg11908 [Pararge aegeria aegeria]